MSPLTLTRARSLRPSKRRTPPHGPDDSKAIEGLIYRWEHTEQDHLVDEAVQVTTNPFAIIKPAEGEATPLLPGLIRHEDFAQWVESPAFQKLVDTFPGRTPRKVNIEDLTISYLGPHIASVQYVAREEGVETDGRCPEYISQTVAVLVKNDGAWKFTLFTKHARVV